MENITNLYDLSSLDISKLKLSDIPDFTAKDQAVLDDLREKFRKALGKERQELSNRIGRLQFLRAADTYRDLATDENITGYEDQEATRALQDLARALKIESGEDKY